MLSNLKDYAAPGPAIREQVKRKSGKYAVGMYDRIKLLISELAQHHASASALLLLRGIRIHILYHQREGLHLFP